MSYERVVKFVKEHPWAIVPAKLEAILELLALRADGVELTQAEIDARIGASWAERQTAARQARAATTPGAISVIPVSGVIGHRMNMMSEISGGASAEMIGVSIRRAAADPNVRAIVLDIDSPGGSVFGIQELGDIIFEARDEKPIVAVANATAASAAFWIFSQASERSVTPSGEVGSIGVFAVHDDVSEAAARVGVRRTFISAGRYKVEGNSFEPLGDEARTYMQQRVDEYYDAFIKAVARGIGVTPTVVRDGFGQGRMVGAKAAVRDGMADRIETFDQVLERLGAKYSAAAPARAAAPASSPRADAAQDDTVDPDADGNCPDGYEPGDDGRCHLVQTSAAAAADLDRRRRRLRLSDAMNSLTAGG